jgi:hypothetical protein
LASTCARSLTNQCVRRCVKWRRCAVGRLLFGLSGARRPPPLEMRPAGNGPGTFGCVEPVRGTSPRTIRSRFGLGSIT